MVATPFPTALLDVGSNSTCENTFCDQQIVVLYLGVSFHLFSFLSKVNFSAKLTCKQGAIVLVLIFFAIKYKNPDSTDSSSNK